MQNGTGESFALPNRDMLGTPGRRIACTLLLLLVIVACARPQSEPPASRREPIPPPPPEISTFVIPIRTSLAPLVSQVESSVPARIAGSVRERGIDVAYDVLRDPIRISAIGQSVHATSALHYSLQACRGRFPCVSCGRNEPRRTAETRLQTTLAWVQDWRLRSTTRVLPVNYATPCEITWFDIDVTRRFVAPVVERELAKVARTIDRQIPRLANVRPQAAAIWAALQEPIEVAPRTWLLVDPVAVALSPIAGSGNVVSTTLHLRTTTRIAVGDKPAPQSRPLAQLTTAPPTIEPSLRVPLDIELPYTEASRLAAAQYAGRTFSISGKPLAVKSIRIGPLPGGRVRIDAVIDYRGGPLRNYEGPVALEGTPRFDPDASRIVLPDLEYSLESRGNLIARLAERALHDEIRDRLRENARLDLAPRLAQAKTSVTAALQRQLAPGVRLNGQIRTLEVNGLIVHPDAMFLRVIAEGEATVEVGQTARMR